MNEHEKLISSRDWRASACDVLDKAVFDYFDGGAGEEATLEANRCAWRTLLFRPRVMQGHEGSVDTRCALFGTTFASPIGIAPTAYHGLLHPEAEGPMLHAANELGVLPTISWRSSRPVSEVAVAGAPWWQQVYLMRDRRLTQRRIEAAVQAGAGAMVLTVDAPVIPRRPRDQRNGFTAWSAGGLERPDSEEQVESIHYRDIQWVKEVSRLPVIVKGVLRCDDARRSVESGADGVWVSNHGGRQLDGSVDTMTALAEIVAELETPTPLFVDGGISSGADVLRALALGAKHVFLGRPVAWGLAVAGSSGVSAVMDMYMKELREAMRLCGANSLDEISADLLTRTPASGSSASFA